MGKALKNQLVNFEIQLTDARPKPDNPMFTLATASILYKGNNRNGSHLTGDSIIKALPTLGGIPVVGEYDKDKDNFKGHGGEVLIKENGEVEFIDTTTPWGSVSELSNFYYEDRVDNDGVTRTYLVADRVNLWTGRYPQLKTLLEEGKFNQSMEIEVQNGSYAVIDGEEVFRIDEFVFSALCILGVNKDSDPYGHVEPCFEGASITINRDENSIFSKRYSLMMEEIKEPNQTEGGQTVTKLTEDQFALLFNAIHQFGQYKLTEEINMEMFNYISYSEDTVVFEDVENRKAYSAKFTIEGETVTVDFENKTEAEGEFDAIFNRTDAVKELYTQNADINKEVEARNQTITEKEAVIADHVAKIGEFQEQVDKLTAEQVDVEAIKKEVKEAFEAEHQTALNDALESVGRLTGDLEARNGEFTALSSEFETAKTELEELRAYRSTAESEAIKEKFSGKIAQDILDSTLEKFAGKSTEEIESALYVEIGKQSFSVNPKGGAKAPQGIDLPQGNEGQELGLYAKLAIKHQVNK